MYDKIKFLEELQETISKREKEEIELDAARRLCIDNSRKEKLLELLSRKSGRIEYLGRSRGICLRTLLNKIYLLKEFEKTGKVIIYQTEVDALGSMGTFISSLDSWVNDKLTKYCVESSQDIEIERFVNA